MSKNVVKKVTVRKLGHTFDFFVKEDGRIEYRIDNGELFAVKQLRDSKAHFVSKQELVIKGDLVDIGSLSLSEADFSALKGAQEAVFNKKEEQAMRKASEERLREMGEEKKEALKWVDSWRHKIRTVKDKDGSKQKYCLHFFQIGNDKYRFVERNLPGHGIVVNPDYKISEKAPDVGGVVKQYGEILFWDYFFEDRGWQRVRALTNNELICLNIIQKHGFFVAQKGE